MNNFRNNDVIFFFVGDNSSNIVTVLTVENSLMMRKNKNSISKNMRQKGATWKLGFFFSLFFIFTSNFLLAFSEKNTSEIIVDSSTLSVNPQTTTFYITEETIVYGLNNISQVTQPTLPLHSKKSKKYLKKKVKALIHTKKKVQIENKTQKQEITVLVSIYPSRNSFEIDNFPKSVGIISVNTYLKSALLNTIINIKVLPIPFINNSLYVYAFFFTKDITDLYSFTRPPPAI